MARYTGYARDGTVVVTSKTAQGLVRHIRGKRRPEIVYTHDSETLAWPYVVWELDELGKPLGTPQKDLAGVMNCLPKESWNG